MPEGNTQYKDHVRAAREWLGRAENSLEQDDHIRGDLDVMLAQAELQRAQEMDEGALRRRWLRRLLPAGTAAILAGIAWGLWPAVPETPPGDAGMTAASAPLVRQEGTVFVSPEQKIGERVSIAEVEIDVPHETAPAAIEETAAEERIMPEQPERNPEQKQAVRLPSVDMQKLMSQAGQSLRAQ